MIIDYFLRIEKSELHGGSVIEDKYWMYNLMYLGDGGKKIPQAAMWLEEMIADKKIEVVATPN
tara:strand:- start:1686 stop:1874 length:189 start_codon:yes stop_codon:yes gene_type:complete